MVTVILFFVFLFYLRNFVVSADSNEHQVSAGFLKENLDTMVVYPYYYTDTSANITIPKYSSGKQMTYLEIFMHETTGLHQVSADGKWGLYDTHLNKVADASEEFGNQLTDFVVDNGFSIEKEHFVESLREQAKKQGFTPEIEEVEKYRSIYLRYLQDVETKNKKLKRGQYCQKNGIKCFSKSACRPTTGGDGWSTCGCFSSRCLTSTPCADGIC